MAKQEETRTGRRGLPPACLARAAGKLDRCMTHSVQYTPSICPPRSQSAPQPSQIFSSTCKYFIFHLPGVRNPPASHGNFSAVGRTRSGCYEAAALFLGALRSAPSVECRRLSNRSTTCHPGKNLSLASLQCPATAGWRSLSRFTEDCADKGKRNI